MTDRAAGRRRPLPSIRMPNAARRRRERRRTRSPRRASRSARCDWQGAYDATSRAATGRRRSRRTRRTGSMCSRTRRGGSAGSTSASRPARARTRATTTLGDRRRAGTVRGVALRALLLQGPARDRRRLAAPRPPCARGRPGVGGVRGPATARGGDGPRVAATCEASAAAAREVVELGRRLRSPDLEAEALQTLGRVLIDDGDPAEGLATLDEAMLFAVEGRLRPYSTGKVYCSLISACEALGDLRRAAEWSEATDPLGAAPSARGVPRVVPCAPGVVAAVARRMGRGRGTSRAGVRGARHAQRDRTPPPATRRSVRSDAGSATSTAPRTRSAAPSS